VQTQSSKSTDHVLIGCMLLMNLELERIVVATELPLKTVWRKADMRLGRALKRGC